MVDRNQAAREREQAQRELGQQLQKFARLLNEGKTGLIDRFGIQLRPGDYLLYRPTFDLIFEVVDIAPVLDQSRPAGYLKLKLACETTIEFVAGQRAMSIVKCGQRSVEEGGAAEIQPPRSQPPDVPSAEPPDTPAAGIPELDPGATEAMLPPPPNEEPVQ